MEIGFAYQSGTLIAKLLVVISTECETPKFLHIMHYGASVA